METSREACAGISTGRDLTVVSAGELTAVTMPHRQAHRSIWHSSSDRNGGESREMSTACQEIAELRRLLHWSEKERVRQGLTPEFLTARDASAEAEPFQN